jgi:glyoxylase-like metal-dependent hydrolase (beta-lactamase superfamily II)
MELETFPVGPLQCNCTLLTDGTRGEAVVIDPGGDEAAIVRRLQARGLKVTAILHTHTHLDHVGATAGVQRATGAPARIHEADLFLYELLPVQGNLLGLAAPAPAELDRFLTDGEALTLGALTIEVIHTPGHSPGSVCFYCRGGEHPVLFSGDTLFAGSIGRTDLWGGDGDAIVRSIRSRLYTLPDETRVIAGHESGTTIGREKRSNLFVRDR